MPSAQDTLRRAGRSTTGCDGSRRRRDPAPDASRHAASNAASVGAVSCQCSMTPSVFRDAWIQDEHGEVCSWALAEPALPGRW